jgi:transposase
MESYLGIDVSKGYADFILLNQEKTVLEKVFQLDDNRAGHDALRNMLGKLIKEHQISMLYCAVESTGGFENNWYSGLIGLSKTMDLKVARLNPNGVKKNVDAGLKRNVTDALSAYYIAEYLIGHSNKVEYNEQSSKYASFRSINKHIKLQLKQQTQIINQLKMILYSAFPEMVCYCRNSVPNWVLEVLAKYPTASKLKNISVEKLCKNKHVTSEKAESLIKKAKASVGSRTEDADGFLITSLAEQLIEKQQLIKKHKQYLEKHCKGPEVTLVESITGIGAYSAAAIMVEIEDIDRFASPKKLVSYFGLHPELKESGDKKAVVRMSKKGRSSVRGTLYMCAQSAVIHDSHFKGIYHNQRKKGMGHKQAIGVIMQKMLRVVWGVLKYKKEYHSDIDKQNQDRKVTAIVNNNERQELKAKRRYSALATDAPVSNKQSKKRKVHLESQAELVGQVRDHQNTPGVKI